MATTLDTMVDKHIGKHGTERCEAFESESMVNLNFYADKYYCFGGS